MFSDIYIKFRTEWTFDKSLTVTYDAWLEMACHYRSLCANELLYDHLDWFTKTENIFKKLENLFTNNQRVRVTSMSLLVQRK